MTVINKLECLNEDRLTQTLAYAGFILLAFELIKSLVIKPTKMFYADISFSPNSPFQSYEENVLSRHKNEFEACLLYLSDFMKAIDSDDVLAIQGLRKHRNDLAHNFPKIISILKIENHIELLEKAHKALFKLSNYQVYMDIGNDPEFQNLGIDWDTVKGTEYLILENIINKIRFLQSNSKSQ
ncbi:MAG: hypothetical protein H0W44_10305 [Gammaproteobacteria bacterium]|nr:hypothetical protein [Gammaproteobacteria bacterium]